MDIRVGLHTGEVQVRGADVMLQDRGAHTLRGMAGQWQLFAVRT